MRLARVDHRHLAGFDRALGLAIVEGRNSLEDDQDLDIRMPVKARPLAGARVDEQHARTDSAVFFADEVPRDDVTGQVLRTEEADRHGRRC